MPDRYTNPIYLKALFASDLCTPILVVGTNRSIVLGGLLEVIGGGGSNAPLDVNVG